MDVPNLKFHHLGLAVKDPQAAQTFLRALGYRLAEPVYDALQAVNLCMCEHAAMPAVELIWPEGDASSPVTNMLRKRDGLVYHLCYISDDVAEALTAIEAMGIRALPLGEPKPAILFNHQPVSFYHLHNIGIIEIIHNH